jgi:hypothetical protein
MNRDRLRQELLYAEDIRAFATPDEIEAVRAHQAEYSHLVEIMRQVEEAPEPLSAELLLRFFRACRTIDPLFPRDANPTSVSVIVGLARQCIEEAIQAGVHTPEGLAVREAGRLLRHEERTKNAWWKDLVSLVAPDDEPLMVIAPRYDHTPEQRRAIGGLLQQWKASHDYVRHIAGLDDLLAGRHPRTPPLYLAVPYQDLPNAYEPVALVFVAKGTDHGPAIAGLRDALGEWPEQLAWFTDPLDFSNQNR